MDGVGFEISPGETYGLLGPNGAGKTTTIEVCEGYRAADAGTVRVLGLDPARNLQKLLPRIGVMLQSGGIPPAGGTTWIIPGGWGGNTVIFDTPAASPLALEYVMFHEMLHLHYPVDHHGVRRRVHTSEFRQAEKTFPRLKEAKELLKKL